MPIREIDILDLDRSIKPLLGSLCWRVSYGIDNLSMEFGQPDIRLIHEPILDARGLRKKRGVSVEVVRRHLNRRSIYVAGQWSLWVYFANWRIVRSNVCLASTSSSMRQITPALSDLNGQRLLRVQVNPTSGATRFTFDLKTVLEVRRRHRLSKDELWLLYGVDGYQRSVRGDGTFVRAKCLPGDPIQ
jgi:hypothetical protein